ncbi:TonB-dependent receptor [Pseudoalteromonas sp. PAR1]|uniref:TonB-dependent receptor n=1 Tax=Pseudoalteromonas sp. PAR1 TaxID=2853443 RepID=UPI00248C3AB1|nr:TonB-dependent receptor [Pseudoalteromonas sp. PAR1]
MKRPFLIDPKLKTLSCSSLVLCVIASAAAQAAETRKDMEVISVYAQKRPQAIEDVSVAVSQVKGQLLKNQHIKDSTEIGLFSPNVKITQNAAEGTPPAISIRGVGLLDYNTANTSPVAMYLDGVAVGSANNQIVNLYDIEQLEILRGPQGTLFGRNSTGGAILIRSNRPELDSYGSLSLGVANNNGTSLDGVWNQQLTDSSALRIAVNYQDYQYSTKNTFADSPTAGMEQKNARVSFSSEWDEVDLYLQAHIEDWDGIVQPVGSIGVVANPLTGELCSPAEAGSTRCVDNFGFNDGSDDFFEVSVNNDSPHKSDGYGFIAEVNWHVNEQTTFTSLSSFNDLQRSHAFNCDGSPARLCEGVLGLDTQMFSQEFRLLNEFADYTLTSGVYFADETIEQDNLNDILRDFRGILPTNLTATFIYDNEIKMQNLAVFSQIEVPVAEQWMITAGLRYDYESLEYDSIATLNTVVDVNDLSGVLVPFYRVTDEQSDNGFTGQIAVNYRYSDASNVYYRFANGSKSGGYNGGFLSSEEQAILANYGKERLNAHEIGLESYWPKQQLRMNWAAFYYDYNDQQVFMNQASETPQMPPVQLLENVADSIIYGLETEINYQATKQLAMLLAVGYIPHAEFEDYVDPLGNSITDNQLPFTSKWNVSAGLKYDTSLASYPLSANIIYDYQSEFYFDQNMNPYARQEAFSIVNAHLKYDVDNWSFTLWGKNLFDTEYSQLKFDLSSFLGMLEDFKGEGRRYGFDVSFQF